MNPAMAIVSVVLMFTLIPIIYAAYIKLSAKLLHINGISWGQGFTFGIIMILGNAILRAIFKGLALALPVALGIAVTLIVHLTLGTLYFRNKKCNSEMLPLGWQNAIKLSGLALAMLALTFGVVVGILKIFIH
ncbi:hypothetical protein SAMN02745119_03074 [Trichlorobacter thiogenes]|uniref:Uncharacterized protein n=1 Tax=Trichlorobacter thiogenes TaxID=115783 RepID=A0A1T4RUH3_9BACT|nr:hypothetical protein [Trichlorobacter thiogenes]SKA19526.1 hypothetical protein SAMN02745119_03074 [Trichlorobacter thiogenes]